MYRLERIVLNNWGRLEPQDIVLRGASAILGPTGAGKSTLIDALQVIMTGANSRYYDLNKSTGGHNARTIRDYCLGADDHISPDAPARNAADALIALAFRDQKTGKPVSIGMIFSAVADETNAAVRSRFVAPDYLIKIDDFIEDRPNGQRVVPIAGRLIERLKQLSPKLRQHTTAQAYVDDYLTTMRRHGATPDPHQVLRNFKQSVAFQPIDDPTDFIRRHILEESHIDVEALKESIARYRYLEDEVVKREKQLAELSEARRRLQVWAGHVVRRNMLQFIIAHGERRRHDILIKRVEAERLEIAKRTENEGAMKRHHLKVIENYQEEHLRQRALLLDVPEAVQARALESDLARHKEKKAGAHTAVQRRVGQLMRLAGLSKLTDRIPGGHRDALDAIADFVQRVHGKAPEALLPIDVDIAALEARIIPIVGAEDHFGRQLEVVSAEIVAQRTRAAELEASLRDADGGAILPAHVRDFVALLAKEGIEAVPLPAIVDVSDANWAMALEMLLGPNREALVIAPGQVGEALNLLWRDRQRFDRCRLVDTRKTGTREIQLDPRSIANIVITENRDAKIFIDRQVGRFLQAHTDHDLEILDQAITKRGKTTQGLSLRVYRDIEPIFGKTAQQANAARARQDLADVSAALTQSIAARDGLQSALATIAAINDEGEDALAQFLGDLAEAEASLRSIALARAALASPEAKKIQDELDKIATDIDLYKREIAEEIEPLLKELADEDVKKQVDLSGYVKARERLLAEEEDFAAAEAKPPIGQLLELIETEDRIANARAQVGVKAEMTPPGRDPAAALHDFVAEARTDAEPLKQRAEDSARRGRNGYFEFCKDHLDEAPLKDPDDGAILRWCLGREQILEKDELIRFRAEFAEAREKMEMDLTEGLINRLSDKFKSARLQINRLNRSLEGRRFTGQSYRFSIAVNAAMKPIHELAVAIADAPQRGLGMLRDNDVDPRVRVGFQELEKRLSDEQLVKDLRDYRKFFDFELCMTNASGQETTLSKRSATGSGGQKQAPYYVAVGAAMASAYFPKGSTGDADGVGLVVFDEAFNNLDAPNTRALLKFFDDMNLQVIIAAPDKVRAMFLETVDTVVSVNRHPATQEPVLTTTHPSKLARETLADLNPVNRGVEAYRPRPEAAE